MASAGVAGALFIRDDFHPANLTAERRMNTDFISSKTAAGGGALPPGWLKQKVPRKSNHPQQHADNDNSPGDVQFCLEFVILGGNSVQQMIDCTALQLPSCHGNNI